MAKGFGFSLVGAEALKKRLTEYSKDIQDRVAAELEDSAQTIRGKALARSPVGEQGANLRQGIGIKQNNKFEWEITSNAKYSAYVEFGTGVYAANYLPSLPNEIREYAKQFYVNGKGRMPARPFLFNSFLEERVRLIEELKKVLKNG